MAITQQAWDNLPIGNSTFKYNGKVYELQRYVANRGGSIREIHHGETSDLHCIVDEVNDTHIVLYRHIMGHRFELYIPLSKISI